MNEVIAEPCVDCGHHEDEHGRVIDEVRLRDGDYLYIYGCRECDDDGECYWDDQYCAWYGQCEHSAICQSWFDCYLELGPGWGCGPSGVCVPEG